MTATHDTFCMTAYHRTGRCICAPSNDLADEYRERHLDRIASYADRWHTAVENARYHKDDLMTFVRSAHAAGVSEYQIAAAAGVQRSTVRAWLGK